MAPGQSSVDQMAASGQAATYASVAVASKNLNDAVQFAVDATIRKHKNEDRDHASFAIHNFRDRRNDANDVREFCEFIECNVCIVRTTWLGHVVKAKKPRFLKVELASSGDRDILLLAAKYLKDDPSTISICISQWVQPDELAKLKSLHDHCRTLNQKSAPIKNGRRKYVVISGKLLERTFKGALRPFKDLLSSSAPFTVNSGQASVLSTNNVTASVLSSSAVSASVGTVSSLTMPAPALANPKADIVASTTTAGGSQAGVIDE